MRRPALCRYAFRHVTTAVTRSVAARIGCSSGPAFWRATEQGKESEVRRPTTLILSFAQWENLYGDVCLKIIEALVQ